MRTTIALAAILTAALWMSPRTARAAHNTVTVSAPVTVTRVDFEKRILSGTVNVRNTTANAQTGPLTLMVFEVDPTGTVTQRARQDLGTVDLPALNGGSVTVPFLVRLDKPGFFIVLADYSSSINGNVVPHTHSGTATADAR